MELINAQAAAVESLFEGFGEQTGLGGDQVKYVTCLLAAIPLGLCFKALPTHKGTRQAFGAFWGLIFCFFCLGRFAWIHSFATATVAYGLMRFAPKQWAHNAVFIFLMAYMSGAHLYRTYTDYLGYHLDFTGPQMLLTQSLTALAFQLHDGNRLRHGIALEEPYLKDKAVDKLPPLLEYYSFVYFFPAFLAGPSHQFKGQHFGALLTVILTLPFSLSLSLCSDFSALCDGSLFPNRKCPSNWSAVVMALLRALLFAPAFYLVTLVPIGRMLDPAFQDYPYLKQWLWMLAGFCFFRSRYYFAWYLSEVSFVASGAGYNGPNKWDRVRNVHPLQVEMAENVRSVTSNWNICTANWLKYYVYWRLPTGPIRTYGTYFVSAFWHGFYPGYYMFFIYAALLTESARVARRVLRPYFVTATTPEKPLVLKPLYDIVGILATMTFVNFGGVGFILLSFADTWAAWRAVHFFGLIGVPVFFMYLSFVHPAIVGKRRSKTA